MDKNKATLELGTKPVGRLLMQYAIPSIIAMTASSLYNMVDSIFIGKGVGPMAISGLAITFPFMNLSAAFGAAIGVGSSTLISVKLGQKDYKTAQEAFGNNITLNVIIGIVFAAICLAFLDPILQFFGASEQTLPYARDYMEVILAGNMITHLYFGMNAVLRAASKPREAMFATMFTVVLNTLLDPLFIYTFDLGIRGAAYATILSQALAMCWQFYLFSNKNELLHLRRGIYHLQKRLVKSIIGIGSSPFAMNACSCLVVIFINTALVREGGDLAVGAYGIGNRIVFIFIMVTMGINQGMQPIAGYNYGAQKYDRMLKVVKVAVLGATCVTTTGWVVCEVFPELCVRLFTNDSQLITESVHGLRINASVLFIIGYQMVITNFFQSIGKAKISIFLSLSRQMLFLIPAIIILSRLMGVDGVWLSLPVSDLLASITTAVMGFVYLKKFNRMSKEVAEGTPVEADESEGRAINFYSSRNGAAPRGMAPGADSGLVKS